MEFIPEYNAPFKPVPNVTPFTIRDGDTMLKKIDYINKYIRRVLIPWIEENYEWLADQFEVQVNELIAAVNAAIQQIIDSSIEVQDPVVATLIADTGSATRQALNAVLTNYFTKTESDAKYETKTDSAAKAADRYTKAEADAKFYTIVSATAANAGFDDRLDVIEALINGSGRLTESYLDNRYLRKFQNPVAVFIGSSNAELYRNWTTELSAEYGWTEKNFAIGGAGFTSGVASNFYTQTQNAINDGSFDNNKVAFFFIVDTSNDTRFLHSVAAESAQVFTLVESAFPNARIIVVPEILPHTDANTSPDIRRTVGRIYNELRNNANFTNRVEVINNTALWFWDTGNWSEGAPIDVHLNATGYDRLRWFLKQYIDHGIEHTNDDGDGTGAVNGAGVIHTRRVGGIVHCYGNVTLAADQNTSVKMLQVYAGSEPIDNIPLIVTRKNDGLQKVWSFEVNGDVNLQIPTPAGTYYFSTSYQTI